MPTKKISHIKRYLLQRAAGQPYVLNETYPKEKQWLLINGYLRYDKQVINGEACILNRYVITEKGREYLATQKRGDHAD